LVGAGEAFDSSLVREVRGVVSLSLSQNANVTDLSLTRNGEGYDSGAGV
jgi:hypothetical protein